MILVTIVVIVSFFCHCESGMLKQSPRADSFTMEGLSQKLREITARLLQASNPRVNELTMEGYCCQFPKKISTVITPLPKLYHWLMESLIQVVISPVVGWNRFSSNPPVPPRCPWVIENSVIPIYYCSKGLSTASG